MSDSTEEFVQNIAENQNRMFAYIYSMLGDHTRTADVLQETNLVLWRKRDEFLEGSPFLPWAFGVARFQVMADIRDRGRDRCLLDQELVELVGAQADQQAERIDEYRAALRTCMSELTDRNRELIQQRYFKSASIRELAESLERGTSAIKVTLLRIRRKLAECVERRLAAGA